MNNTIKFCYKNHVMASFYFNRDDNLTHLTGFVYAFNEDELLIAHISPRGMYDGFILNQITNIYRIDYNGEYENKIQKLYDFQKQKHSNISITEESILFPMLDWAKEYQKIISLELKNNSITGFVKEYNDYIITIQLIADTGLQNGISKIEIDEIVTFTFDSDYEQDLKILFTNIKAGEDFRQSWDGSVIDTANGNQGTVL